MFNWVICRPPEVLKFLKWSKVKQIIAIVKKNENVFSRFSKRKKKLMKIMKINEDKFLNADSKKMQNFAEIYDQ